MIFSLSGKEVDKAFHNKNRLQNFVKRGSQTFHFCNVMQLFIQFSQNDNKFTPLVHLYSLIYFELANKQSSNCLNFRLKEHLN